MFHASPLPVRTAQTTKMSAPGPRVRRHSRTSRTRKETRQRLTQSTSQKSELALENSHHKNTEQLPDVSVAAQYVKPHLHGRLFCNAIRRFFMRENLSRKAVTHTRQDSLAAIAFGKNRCHVSNTCDLRCQLYFCATRCNNRSRP